MAREYDIYLDGRGYMVPKTPGGLPQERRSDPFMNHVARGERWQQQAFRFADGAGAQEFDGSNRYRLGQNIDTRSGRLLRGPKLHKCQDEVDLVFRVADGVTITDQEISTDGAAVQGFGVKFQVPAGKTSLQSVAYLIKRNIGRDYNGSAAYTIEIRQDAAGTPGAVVQSSTLDLRYPNQAYRPYYGTDPFDSGEYFWQPFRLATPAAVVAGNWYWLCITNAQVYELYWGRWNNPLAFYLSTYNGAAWSAQTTGEEPFFKINFEDEIDWTATCMAHFTGADNIPRLMAGMGKKVMYWRRDGVWLNSKSNFADLVIDLLEFDGKLFTSLGILNDMWYYDGTTATTTWTQVAGEQAGCFAIHDNMLWKAEGANGADVVGSVDGVAWPGAAVTVGDPQTEVAAMVSHGGALFAAKVEGIYQITYPDTYPGSGTPAANLVLDFSTEKALRPWMLSWHQGLYFPGISGVYEWKSGILRDVWSDRVDDEVQQILGTEQVWTPSRKFSPQTGVNPISRGLFMRAFGTTRGMILAMTSPHLEVSSLWWFTGRTWHPIVVDNSSDWVGEYILALYLHSSGSGEGILAFSLGHEMCYLDWPTWTVDRANNLGSDFAQKWLVELPRFSGDKPRMLKNFHKVGVTSKNVAGATQNQVTVYYVIDGPFDAAPTWTELDTVSHEPYQEFILPAHTTGHDIRLRLAGNAINPTDETFEIDAVDLFFQELPETVALFEVAILAGRNLKRHGGGVDNRATKDIYYELRALLEKIEAWTYIDDLGISHQVMALGTSRRSAAIVEKSGPTGFEVEAQFIVTMIEIPTTVAASAGGGTVAGAFLATKGDGLYVSDNFAYDNTVPTWRHTGQALAIDEFAVDRSDPAEFQACRSGDSIYARRPNHYHDNNWHEVLTKAEIETLVATSVSDISWIEIDDGRMYTVVIEKGWGATGQSWLIKSVDYGVAWVAHSIITVKHYEEGAVWAKGNTIYVGLCTGAGGSACIYYSITGGGTWVLKDTLSASSWRARLMIDPLDADRTLVGEGMNGPDLAEATTPAGAYTHIDGGLSAGISISAVHGAGWVYDVLIRTVRSGTIYLTDDGASNWESRAAPFTDQHIWASENDVDDVAVAKTTGALVGTPHIVKASPDRGATWYDKGGANAAVAGDGGMDSVPFDCGGCAENGFQVFIDD